MKFKLISKKVKIFTTVLPLMLLSAACFDSAKADDDYYIRSVNIFAQVNADGSMDIREERTYYFDGSFSYAFYELPLDQTGGLSNFSMSERGVPYREQKRRRSGIRW